MGIRETITSVATLLRDNAALQAYCQEKYGKNHTVVMGENQQNPLGDAHTPLLCIFSIQVTEQDRKRQVSISIGIQVSKDLLTIESNLGEYEGFLQAEEVRELVRNAIAREARLIKPSFKSATVQNSIYPFWTTVLDVSWEEVVTSTSAQY